MENGRERQDVFVAGLLTGLGLALRRSEATVQEDEQWQAFLHRLTAARTESLQGVASAQETLERALWDYVPTRTALSGALSAEDERFTGAAKDRERRHVSLTTQALSEELEILEHRSSTAPAHRPERSGTDSANKSSSEA